jgi:hypothetical protein
MLNVYQDPNNQLHIKRQLSSSENNIQTIPIVNGVSLENSCGMDYTQAEGTFRVTRSGTTIKTFPTPECSFLEAFDGPVIVSLVLLGPGPEFEISSVAFDNFVIYSGTLVDPSSVCPFEVSIDIKPDDYPNSINLGSHGTVPVAILSTPYVFDATDVDPATVGLAGAGVALKGTGMAMASVQDVDADGWMDLVVHVNTAVLELTESDTLAVLTGKTYGEVFFWGTDSVYTVQYATPHSCIQPPAGLTDWWPGDGTSADIIGGQDADLRDNATTGPGLVGGAFVLDGDGDYVNVPDDPALNFGIGDFTVALWVFFNDTGGEQVLAEKYIQRFETLSEGWTLTKLEDNRLLFGTASATEDWAGTDTPDPLPIAALTWNHFAATRDAGQLTIFMNGVPVASTVASSVNVDSNSSLKFGHRGNMFDPEEDTPGSNNDQVFFLNGRIDEAQIFVGRALPPAEIRAIFEAGRAGMCK